MLSLDMVRGDRNALRDQSSIIPSATVARNLFGTADPMGKIVKVNNNELHTVTGVYTDLPGNSSFSDCRFIVPFCLQGTYRLDHRAAEAGATAGSIPMSSSTMTKTWRLVSLAIRDVKLRMTGRTAPSPYSSSIR